MIGHFLLALAAAAAPTKLPPIDECAVDPTFVKFRAGLIAAADKHDMEAVVSALDDKVLVDFGGGSGKDAFREKWTSEGAKEVDLWGPFEEALTLGCALIDSVAVAPSFSAQLDVDADMFEVALAKPGTTVRSEAGDAGKVIATLDWDLVRLVAFSMNGDGAFEVKLADGRTGYVKPGQLRIGGAYRLTMEKRDDTWRITAFVAGD